jgi:hypothetical protein
MLTTYLADVEQMLEEHRLDAALRDAFALPRIAVALTDPALTCSNERCKAWCEQWIRPLSAANESGLDHERICRIVCAQDNEEHDSTAASVPSGPLRRLRLRRHARKPPRGFKSEHLADANGDAAESVGICMAVVEGVRQWYAHCACHDATAQANLARLAVLR